MVESEQHVPALPRSLPVLASKSFGRRLQRVSLRTKIVVPMVALTVLPVVAIGVFTITWTRSSLHESAIERVDFDTSSKAERVAGFLETVLHDLRFLTQTKIICDLADSDLSDASGHVTRLRAELAREFYIFSQGKRAFYQVRYLSNAGREVVRLDVEDGRPLVVPTEQLQDKSGRYYVQAGWRLESGQIYVSPMDLNVEHGIKEAPYRGVVRFVTPVIGRDKQKRGLLVLNINADYLLSLLGPLPAETEGWLVDEAGAYLGYVGQSKSRHDLFNLAKRRRLSADHPNETVSAILESRDGSKTVENRHGLLSFSPIGLTAGTGQPATTERRWFLLMSHDRASIDTPIRHLTVFLSVITAVVAAIAGVLGALVGHYLTRPVSILRRATREVAADLSKHVEVTTGDEIEGLANDFNVMIEQLREAQERLSAWNGELEREVARKTDDLHRLQGGLAKAEKLASIGQMTASVMHEIGNPLAAIKTRIQVAEEERNPAEEFEPLLADIIDEVDRLTVFLRSFSQMARLGEPRMEMISSESVVQGVITLIGPELRRRGVALRVESPPQAPSIFGDPHQLRQLLINLLLNAAEASSPGTEILVTVGLRPFHSAGRGLEGACLEVLDHGAGMSEEAVKRIWDPFFTTRADGTGLGLAICRQIVEDHRGTIWVQSEPHEGTLVTVNFPDPVAERLGSVLSTFDSNTCEERPAARDQGCRQNTLGRSENTSVETSETPDSSAQLFKSDRLNKPKPDDSQL